MDSSTDRDRTADATAGDHQHHEQQPPLEPLDPLHPMAMEPCPPPPRVQYTLETPTTELQRETEDECSPFFVNLRGLPDDQVRHLRMVGLLPPESKSKAKKPESEVGAEDKAATVLGLDGSGDADAVNDAADADADDSEGGPRIEVLDEIPDPVVPAPQQQRAAATDENDNDDGDDPSFRIRLLRSAHRSYLHRALTRPLSPSYVSLDASRPWIVYWTLHSLDLLDALPEESVLVDVVKALEYCWTECEGGVEVDVEEVREDAVLRRVDSRQQQKGNNGKTVRVPAGGFGGNAGQMPHCAPTYAAILALCIVYGAGHSSDAPSSKMALELMQSKRGRLYAWFLSLRHETPLLDGGGSEDNGGNDEPKEMEGGIKTTTRRTTMTAYRMHHDGEIDVRATYTMLSVAHLLRIDTPLLCSPSTADFVASCQTYEGGFGGEPHSEAHGGYTYCALAALRLLGVDRDDHSSGDEYGRSGSDEESIGRHQFSSGRQRLVEVDVDALRGWLARRQMAYEGGFAGRTNKLVDGCYSFWQGGAMAVLDAWRRYSRDDDGMSVGVGGGDNDDNDGEEDEDGLCFDRHKLQRYVLLCAQDVNGGLRDKPSKPRDFYHSCYNLSGLSVAQHVLAPGGSTGGSGDREGDEAGGEAGGPADSDRGGGGGGGAAVVHGDAEVNVVGETHPVFNVRVERVRAVMEVRYNDDG